MKIAILVGSTRPGRKGTEVARWILERASQRDDAEFEIVELADFDLPLLCEPTIPGAAKRDYATPQTRVWSAKVDEFDGFVWVTPEYNHGVPAAMKNALDVLYPEWNHKAVGFVSYGANEGVRAVEHWRGIVANVLMVATRGQLTFSTFSEWPDGVFTPSERREGELRNLLKQLVAMTGAVGTLRS
ncbi:MAG: NADPH-dependent FMN reductase [Marmoricola sp.]